MARVRAARLDPAVRRGLIVDAAERLLVEHDPLLLTFDQVATEAGVSRSLVHAYLGDRRGLIDAVQVRIVGRLDRWVGHGFDREAPLGGRVRALVAATCAFVDAEREAWSVLTTTGGLDHPSTHALRQRWVGVLVAEGGDALGAQVAVAALLQGTAGWVARGIDPADLDDRLVRLVLPGEEPEHRT